MELTKEEILRYSRHIIMPEITIEGQKKLKSASVLLIGAGGLGSPSSAYLTAAGIGKIGIVDFDVVDLTNLQRQIIHGTDDVGRSKLDSARATLLGINPIVKVETYEVKLTSNNAMDIFSDYDVIIDGTDNFPTRYLVNDACVLLGKPNIYGSIFRFEGQASVFYSKEGPCYRCLYPDPPPPGTVPSCAEGGVLGILPGIIGVIQATEAIKLIVKKGEPLIGRLLLFDALKMRFSELKLRKFNDCPICGNKPTIKSLIDCEHFCGIQHEQGGDSPSELFAEDDKDSISPEELNKELKNNSDLFLLDVREPEEFQIGNITGAKLIPLKQIPSRINEINRSRDIVVYCKSGKRSAEAIKLLNKEGINKTRNLSGGIIAWSQRVDPAMPIY